MRSTRFRRFNVDADADAFAYVVYPIVGVLVLWLLRFSELALFSPRECARRESRSPHHAPLTY